MDELQKLVVSAQESFSTVKTAAGLEDAKAVFLGKSGHITQLMKGLSALPVEERKVQGAVINKAKQEIETALNARRQALADAELEGQLQAEALDVTLPGKKRHTGGLHPVALAQDRIEKIFSSMGFAVADGPEIETDWFNFGALNMPDHHPARSMHDTFYVEQD
ncbi:MAG: phenylalanine--tRNA ligase subunit alpha, partial [Saezia sp.]